MILVFLFADTSLTAVSTDELTAAGKFIDGQTAVIGTSAAVCHRCCIFQLIDLVNGKHCCLFARLITLSRDQSRTKRTHDTCDIRTDRFTACDLLKASQYRIIIKSTTLYNDMPAKFCRIRNLDNLVKRVLDNRVRKTCGNIRYLRALFLRLFYLGVHKYGTACSKVDWMLCKKRCLRKILHTVVQRFRKSLDKGTTAGRTCLI